MELYLAPTIIIPVLFALLLSVDFVMTFTPAGNILLKQNIEKGSFPQDYLGRQVLYFQRNHLVELRRLNWNEISYDSIIAVKKDSVNFYIFIKGKRFIMVPFSAIKSQEQQKAILEYLTDKSGI